MRFEIEKKIVETIKTPVDVRLEKTSEDIVLRVNGLYVFAIKKDGTGRLYGGLEDNKYGLETNSGGKLKIGKG